MIWISSSSTRGGTPPFLSPYFAAKAAMDSLAVSYSTELSRWGIETSIVVPGAFTKGTNHFAHSGSPEDTAVAAEYTDGPYKGVPEQALKGLAALEPIDADPAAVAVEIVRATRSLVFLRGTMVATGRVIATADGVWKILKWRTDEATPSH